MNNAYPVLFHSFWVMLKIFNDDYNMKFLYLIQKIVDLVIAYHTMISDKDNNL